MSGTADDAIEASGGREDLLAALEQIVESTAVVAPTSLMDLPLDRITDDLARKIYPAREIASRYGLTDAQLIELVQNPEIAKLIKTKRGVFMSDAAADERLRAYWRTGLIESSPQLIAMLTDKEVTNPVKVEVLKVGIKIAGVDGAPRQDNQGSVGGPGFNVQIIFSDRPAERISATIDGQSVPTVVEDAA